MRESSGGFTEKYLYSRGKGKKRYDAVFKELARKNGLTQNEVDVILFLANNPSFDTARDIVEYRSMSKSHVCKSVESLSQKGLLSGRQDEEDRRVTHLLLTPCAHELTVNLKEAQKQFFAGLLAGVTPEEMELFGTILDKIIHNIEGDMDYDC